MPGHEKDRPELEGECTLPPDHPLPPDQLGRYSPERDYHAERQIAEYVEGQCHGEEVVENVERVKAEYVAGVEYEIYDVQTDKDRWWVITNATNLYSQKHFPSLDYTLSFHVGLMMRVMSKRREGEDEGTPFDEVLRRLDQGKDLLERAVEAVEFQAVGMQLREALISLMTATRRRVELTEADERPKDADVVGWNRVLTSKLCGGSSNDELRAYVRATVEKAWPLVNWLTHHRNATKTAALIAFDAVEAILKHYLFLVTRERHDRVEQCPNCSSRDMRSFFDRDIPPDGEYFDHCGPCGWHNHPGLPEEDEEADEGKQT